MLFELEEMDEPVQRVVKLGIEWLEMNNGEEWAEDIWSAVVDSEFNMMNCEHCAVGTAIGDYYDNFCKPLNPENPYTKKIEIEASSYGFFASEGDSYNWEELAQGWAAASYQRLISKGVEPYVPEDLDELIHHDDYDL